MKSSHKARTSLPENYVTLLDLRERWMQQQKQKQKQRVGKNGDDERNFKAQVDQGVENSYRSPEKSNLVPNPNPRYAIGSSENRNGRLIRVSQPKTPNVVRLAEAKALPVIRVNQSKPSLLRFPKVESDIDLRGEISRSGKKVVDGNNRGKIEGKLEGLSLSSGKGESSGVRSVVVRNRGRVMLQKDRVKERR